VDTLELSRFVLAEPGVPIRSIMDRSFVALSPFDDREKAVQTIQKFDLTAVPVVGEGGVLLGVVTVDDVLDILEEEMTEDFHKQAAVAPFRASYPHLGVWTLFRKRVPWVAVLVLVYFLASRVISGFEATLAAELVLASFIPLLMGSAGNVGAQAGTLMVRALGTETLPRRLWARAMAKEILVGTGLGLTLGILAGVMGYFQGGWNIAAVVAAAMLLIVVIANLFGFALPLLLDRLGADPAVAASSFITSLTDITSLIVYFTIAAMVM
jgi:magnesium transporter